MTQPPEGIPVDMHADGITRRRLMRLTGAGALTLSAGGLLAACGGDSSSGTTAPAAAGGSGGGAPKRGGMLTLGASGGSDKDTLEAQNLLTNCDYARGYALYEGLTTMDKQGKIVNLLAESIEPNKNATEWTIRLRPGVVMHDGKTFGAKDVLFSFDRIIKQNFPGKASLGPIDLKASKAVDERTVRLAYDAPYGILPEQLALIYAFMVPVGYDPRKPVGTGPFKFESFDPGQQSTFVRHADYWDEGKPYLDKLVITNIVDETAQVNALQAGQVDAIDYLSSTSLAAVEAAGAQAIIARTGAWGPFTMRLDRAPFSDNRVRLALKLVIDRQQMLEQVFSGHGSIGNDVWGIFDADFDAELPQRDQDLEQAKSLLRAAGQSDLRVELITTPNAPGQVQAAQVFATQAKAAGITTKITNQTPTEYFDKSYLKVPFSQDYWPYQPYLVATSYATISRAAYSATHQSDKAYDALFKKASSTTDPSARRDAIHEMLKYDHDQGGDIIPYHFPVIDAVSAKVKGVEPSVTGVAMGTFDWKSIWVEG